MQNRFAVVRVLGLGLALAAVACSAESKEPVSADESLAAFRNPTGSFGKENGAAALSGFDAEKSESGKVNRPGASSGTSRTQGIRVMNGALGAEATCAEGQSCACPGGGSIVYRAEQSSIGAAAHFAFSNCVDDEGAGFDGEAVVAVAKQPILGLAKTATTPVTSDNIFFAAKGTAFDKTTRIALEFALLHEAGYTLLAVQVADGKIVIGSAPDGTLVIKAKQGTFHCGSAAGGYTCKGDETGEEIAIGGEAQASNDEAAPPEEPALPDDESGL